ncbi:hypothetical protein AB0F17_20465 [Nonomuraea sp. NPDC026600]
MPIGYRVVDPRAGRTVATGRREPGRLIEDQEHGARVIIFYDE